MNTRIKDIVLVAVFVAVISVSAIITIPFGAVPFTLQTFAITLVLYVTKPKTAIATLALYIALGAIGAPIFSAMKGGIGNLLGPTGGFLWGYLIGIFPVCALLQKTKSSLLQIVEGCLLTFIAYMFGCAQYMFVAGVNLLVALLTTVAPFVIIDTVKIIVAWGISKKVLFAQQ